jgi:hypothetical protein
MSLEGGKTIEEVKEELIFFHELSSGDWISSMKEQYV